MSFTDDEGREFYGLPRSSEDAASQLSDDVRRWSIDPSELAGSSVGHAIALSPMEEDEDEDEMQAVDMLVVDPFIRKIQGTGGYACDLCVNQGNPKPLKHDRAAQQHQEGKAHQKALEVCVGPFKSLHRDATQ
jgi:hypothetical protein